MAKSIDFVCTLREPPSEHAKAIARSLIEYVSGAQATRAPHADIVAGYRLAADRVAAWAEHGDWRLLING